MGRRQKYPLSLVASGAPLVAGSTTALVRRPDIRTRICLSDYGYMGTLERAYGARKLLWPQNNDLLRGARPLGPTGPYKPGSASVRGLP